MTDATEHAKRLQMLLDAATESLLEASDEEILEDIRDTGCDPARQHAKACSATVGQAPAESAGSRYLRILRYVGCCWIGSWRVMTYPMR